MRILFTGGSSFTGMWFVKTLAEAGHHVTATLLHDQNYYTLTRKERVDILHSSATIIDNCPFGTEKFLKLIQDSDGFDLLCHHAANVTNYKSPAIDYINAVKNNTLNIEEVIHQLQSKGCKNILLTGSVFEQGEGSGSDNLRAVSPYGLSKGLTSDIFKYFCAVNQCNLKKFVIPNPFGPYEEERFTSYLIKKWFAGKEAPVSHPDYLRDNIHVSLLAQAYVNFIAQPNKGYIQCNPSGYIETQGEFATRFAHEMHKRLSIPCELKLLMQQDFSEPKTRVNTDTTNERTLQWNEIKAWDELAKYYQQKYQPL